MRTYEEEITRLLTPEQINQMRQSAYVNKPFSMQNKANLQKNFEYALWTDPVFFRDCNELLKEPFIFSVEKDYKKEVIAEYDVQAGTL